MQKYPFGPNNWPDWIKRYLPGQKKFVRGAVAHDFIYEFCKDEEDRKKADLVFLELCIEDSTSLLWETWACVCYVGIRIGGKNRIGR